MVSQLDYLTFTSESKSQSALFIWPCAISKQISLVNY